MKLLARRFTRSKKRPTCCGPFRGAFGSLLLGLGLVVLCSATLEACPLCAEAVENQANPNAAGVMKGFFWGILFMMAMPFVLFGGFTALLVRAHRRSGDEQRADELPRERLAD